MSLVESLDRMSINKKYRQYEPSVTLKQKPQAWWNYAITSVLEEDVKRRTRMWSWSHIREHRYVRDQSYPEFSPKFS
jgi:vacuolar protein sorting-associated protein 13A/C